MLVIWSSIKKRSHRLAAGTPLQPCHQYVHVCSRQYVTFRGRRYFAGVTNLGIMRWRGYLEYLGGPRKVKQEGQSRKRPEVCALGRWMSQGTQWPREAGQGTGTEASRGTQTHHRLDYSL